MTETTALIRPELIDGRAARDYIVGLLTGPQMSYVVLRELCPQRVFNYGEGGWGMRLHPSLGFTVSESTPPQIRMIGVPAIIPASAEKQTRRTKIRRTVDGSYHRTRINWGERIDEIPADLIGEVVEDLDQLLKEAQLLLSGRSS